MTNLATKLETNFSDGRLAAFRALARLAGKENRRSVLVGGVVRDLLIGVPAGDVDVMLEHPAQPFVEMLAGVFHAKLVSHERFHTFTLTLPSGEKIDIVTAREESYAAPGQLPNVVPSTIEKDLKRRDFTVNAIACWLDEKSYGEVLDPFNGQSDIKAKLVRALHDQSFVDDPTRVFRAARFASRLGYQVEGETEKWISAAVTAKRPAQLSPVRRRHEFELILKEKNPLPALRLVQKWKVLEQLHPDWTNIDLSHFSVKYETPFEQRLAEWFRPWGKDRAPAMMTDLGFEKTIKKSVLSCY